MFRKLCFFLFITIASTQVNAQKSYTDSLSGTEFLIPADFKAKYDVEAKTAQLVDVRTPDEFKKNHLPNAINISYYNPEFLKNLDQLDKSKTIYIYCATGGRSKATASALHQKQFKGKVYALFGFYSDLGLLYGIKPEEVKKPNKF